MMTYQKLNRRSVLAGIGTAAVAAPVLAQTKTAPTQADVAGAEALAGVEYTAKERAQLLKGYEDQLESLRRLRALALDNQLAPATIFDPRLKAHTASRLSSGTTSVVADNSRNAWARRTPTKKEVKAARARLHTLGVQELVPLLGSGKISSRELTEHLLTRAQRLNATLQCWARLTPDIALAEADKADALLRAGSYLGPLHGVPYALKDIFDTKDVVTSWGAEPFATRSPREDATIVKLLRSAGAVLLGKATTGALAYGDIWDGGMTRNPWNVLEGSSGSSAGSASAVASGCAVFGIGSETLGSIISPSNRCGTAGLRPTFGRVSRAGAMALCWSLDKIGPICRTAADTLLVLKALVQEGGDPLDPATLGHRAKLKDMPAVDPSAISLGYNPKWFAEKPANDVDRKALEVARQLGFKLVEVAFPDLPYGDLGIIIEAEAAAAFEELTLSGKDELLKWQDDAAWPNIWRRSRFLPAIDYVNAQRLRRKVMAEMAKVMDKVHALLHPNYAANLLMIGNMTGHPALAIRAGFVQQPSRTLFEDDIAAKKDQKTYRVPQAISLTGHLDDEALLVAIGAALETGLNVWKEQPVLPIS